MISPPVELGVIDTRSHLPSPLMCDATHMAVLAEPLPELPIGAQVGWRPACDGCTWLIGAVVCFSPQTGCFVLCQVCAERLTLQTAMAYLLQEALCRPVSLI